ncbi:MAG: DedA family protein [Deltaproteobacteria bacterium]|nr:DedA family protein [Deltaproteobacteria bacterium]
MTLKIIVETYGYWAIWVGTFLEGETILVLGGFAAHRGFLSLPWVMLAAFTGSLLGDQFFFYLGRRHSETFLRWRPTWRPRLEKADRLFTRIRTPLVLFFRFLYGLRAVLPFMFGMSSIPTGRFILLNLLGAAVWAVTVATGGYFFGELLTVILGEVKQYELYVLAGMAVVGMLLWLWHQHRLRKNKIIPKENGR